MQDHVIVLESCKNLRALGRDALRGKWTEAILATLIYCVIVEVPGILISAIFGGDSSAYLSYSTNGGVRSSGGSTIAFIYMMLINGPLTFGIVIYYIRLFRRQNCELSLVMSGFDRFGKTLALWLYIFLFVFLWTLLFVVPGIIAAIRYSQSFYILADNPQMRIPDIVNESKRMMYGNKGKFFLMNLSFIGWCLLASIPAMIIGAAMAALGFESDGLAMDIAKFIGSLFEIGVMSYMFSTGVAFYDILSGRLMPQQTEIPGQRQF
ncbi:MAG: DUF975 family protein [Anaerovoracaceae bacterium]|jgi:uncharacterized membrane protein